MNVSPEQFQSVLTAAVDGSEWAWSELYHAYAGRVRGYLRSRGATEPDDLVGDVFLQLARNLSGFTGDEAAFRSWLFMVAHHRLIDERRRNGRRPVDLVDEPSRLEQPADVDVAGEVVATVTGDELYELLGELTEDQRTVLVMRMIGGLTLAETAEALGRQLGAVTQLQRRGLAGLRRQMDATGVTQ
jgi:RNA polymerase sigma-70 factor (ECF subfamily)